MRLTDFQDAFWDSMNATPCTISESKKLLSLFIMDAFNSIPTSPNSCHGNMLPCQDEKVARPILLMHEWTRETSEQQNSPEFGWHHCKMQFCSFCQSHLKWCLLHTDSSYHDDKTRKRWDGPSLFSICNSTYFVFKRESYKMKMNNMGTENYMEAIGF